MIGRLPKKSDVYKVAVIGTGLVGSTFAYTLMLRNLVSEIVLIDRTVRKAEGDAMDLNHGMAFTGPTRIWAGSYEDISDADIIVIAAGAAQQPGETRLDLVKKNTEIFRSIVAEITKHNNTGIIVVATNPVDVLTYVTWRLSGWPAERVIGSGTILDTARFRFLLGQHCGVDPRSVHAYIIGEHGDSEIPVWSLANVAGIGVQEYCLGCERACEGHIKEEIFEQVRRAAYEIIDRKGATYYAIALGLYRITESIIRDEQSVLTVSTLLRDYHGISDVCLGIPVLVGSQGAGRQIRVPLAEEELAGLRQSAKVIREVIDQLDLP